MNYCYTCCIVLALAFLAGCKCNRSEIVGQNSPDIVSTQQIPPDSCIDGSYMFLERTRYDFGKINRRKVTDIVVDFEFRNTGKKPLIIIKTDVSCGCLSVDYPKKPILSGERAKMTVNIDTRFQEGMFNKTIFVKTNAVNDVELIRIVGEIKK